ncbi:ABC transporter permease subunit [Conexibacter arvalis]|uniref:Alpha-glucoside transport system permease protein n=1 Tax=Conexibacter arvalis TaxID=912552 RepID=A0A840IJN9_9ACTN|nr:alpha-glucoside transport system permease protein [Conexibacter arvalis]
MEAATVTRRRGGGRGRARLVPLLFLAPALIFLVVWVIYPTIWTIGRSFFDRDGGTFVWFDNYQEIFTTDTLLTAIRNNVIWVAVVPALVTAIGLIFAVLTERVRWSTAFKTAVFMPMAISLFAAGVIWRIMDEKDPAQGTVNAVIKVFDDAFGGGGAVTAAQSSTPQLTGSISSGFVLRTPLRAGDTAVLGLTAIPPDEIPRDAPDAQQPSAEAGAITGTVWRDFKPGGGRPGVVEPGEQGIGGATLELRDNGGGVVATTSSEPDGSFAFDDVGSGQFRVAIASSTFTTPFEGVSWLGEKLITPAVMIAYIWVWAGFAMVIIAAGLSAISREVLEAARTDGATEWQVFRRVTVPMLAPVLSVVFITMIINVLKVFDIILSVAPQSSQDDANVIALAMWRTSFGGVNDFGLGSAIAVFLFLLVIPVLALNIRRFKREEG